AFLSAQPGLQLAELALEVGEGVGLEPGLFVRLLSRPVGFAPCEPRCIFRVPLLLVGEAGGFLGLALLLLGLPPRRLRRALLVLDLALLFLGLALLFLGLQPRRLRFLGLLLRKARLVLGLLAGERLGLQGVADGVVVAHLRVG